MIILMSCLEGVNTGDFGGDDRSDGCGEHGDCGESDCGGGKSGAGDAQADFFGDAPRGGVAGFAKGGADVELIEDGDQTILRYTAKAETGGKLAQLGARLITSTAKKLSKMFFATFEKVMSGEVEVEESS